MSLRIDRINLIEDEFGNKHVLLIDYKTGANVDVTGWSIDKLNQPQLPIYATYVDYSEITQYSVDGIAYAHVAAGKCAYLENTKWTGHLVKSDNQTKHPNDHWNDQINVWKAALHELASEFMAGKATATHKQLDTLLYDDLLVFYRDTDQ